MPGIVDQHVQAAESGHGLGHDPPDIGHHGEIALQQRCTRHPGRLQRLGVVVQRQPAADLREGARGGGADAAAGAVTSTRRPARPRSIAAMTPPARAALPDSRTCPT